MDGVYPDTNLNFRELVTHATVLDEVVEFWNWSMALVVNKLRGMSSSGILRLGMTWKSSLSWLMVNQWCSRCSFACARRNV